MPRPRVNPERPTPNDIWQYWLAAGAALEEQLASHRAHHRVLTGPYVGLSPTDAQERLDTYRLELANEVVLALVGSFEAILRLDFLSRCDKGNQDHVVRAFLSAHSKSTAADPRTRLRLILEAWWSSHSDKAALRAFERLLDYRNWLAHGRWWEFPHRHSPRDASEIANRVSRSKGFPPLRLS